VSSAYPSGIDALSTSHLDDGTEVIHAATVNDLADAVNKIEAELGTLPKGGSADVKTRIAATETVANAAVPKSTVTTAGDIIYATGNAAVTRLALGAAGTVLGGGASAPAYVKPPGYIYNRKTYTGLNITATTEGTAQTVVTGDAVTFDGSTNVWIEFYSPSIAKGTSNITLWLFEDGSSIGRIGFSASTNETCTVRTYRTPASGSRTYSVRANVDAGTGAVNGAAGGASTYMPGYLLITQA
jgi:hypothetical protein